MVTSGSLGGVIISTVAWNIRSVCSIPALDVILPISIILTTLVDVMILYKVHTAGGFESYVQHFPFSSLI